MHFSTIPIIRQLQFFCITNIEIQKNGSFLKLYIPSTLKFDRKAGFLAFTPSTSVLDKEQSVATVCIRQHA